MAKEVIVELKVDSGDAEKDIKKINKGLEETNEQLDDQAKASKKAQKGIGGIAKGFKSCIYM